MKKILPSLIIIFLAQFFTTMAVAQSGTPAVHIAPKPAWLGVYKPYNQKPNLRTVQKGYFFALIEEQVHVEKQETYSHYIREIVSDAGVQNGSEISVGFEPAYEKLEFHEITVWRDNKPQNRLKLSAFKVLADEQEFSKFIYDGTYSASYILDDIRKGDRIEYSYTVTGRNPVFKNKFCRTIYMQGYMPVAHEYKTLIVADSRKVIIKPFNKVVKPVITLMGNGLKKYEWEDFQVPGYNGDDSAPGWYNDFARIQVSDYNNWAEVVDWSLAVNPIITDVKGELKTEIDKLKQQAGNDQVKYFRSAVKLVQNEVRYMGIETGVYSHTANRPENVFKQRYGDCKDKSLLLVTLLEANGIEAHMVLINTDYKTTLGDFLPSAMLFDHATVVATVKNKQIWVDATIAYQGGSGTDIYYPNYGEGLVIKKGNIGLTIIPKTKYGKITCEESYNIPNEKDTVTLDVKTTYTLNQADIMRNRLASSATAETEKNYLDYYAKLFPKIVMKDSVIIKDNEDKNELTTIESYRIADFFKKDSVPGKYTQDFYASFIDEQLPNMAGKTKTPVAINFPYALDYTVKIKLPYGWDSEDKHTTVNNDFFKFSYDKTVDYNTLSLHYNFAYLRDYVPVAQLAQFSRDVKQLKDDELSFGFYYTPDLDALPFKLNKWMAVFAAVLALLLGYIGYVMYRRETEPSGFYRSAYREPLTGFLVLVMISLAALPFKLAFTIVDEKYLSLNTWNDHVTGIKSITSKILLVFEVFGNITLLCYAVFCFILMWNRRDIFPRVITGLYLFAALFTFVDYVFGQYINDGANSNDAVGNILVAVLVGVVCTRYFKISPDVRNTFTVPYPKE